MSSNHHQSSADSRNESPATDQSSKIEVATEYQFEEEEAVVHSTEEVFDLNVFLSDGSVRNPFKIDWKLERSESLSAAHIVSLDECELEAEATGGSSGAVDLRMADNMRKRYKPFNQLLETGNRKLAEYSSKIWNRTIKVTDVSDVSPLSQKELEKINDGSRTNGELMSRIERGLTHAMTDEEILTKHFRENSETDCKLQILRAQIFGDDRELEARKKWYEMVLNKNNRQTLVVESTQSPAGDLDPTDILRTQRFDESRIDKGYSHFAAEGGNKPTAQFEQEIPLHLRFGDKRMTFGFREFRQRAESYRLLFEMSAVFLKKTEEIQFHDTNRPNFGWSVAKPLWEKHMTLVLVSCALD